MTTARSIGRQQAVKSQQILLLITLERSIYKLFSAKKENTTFRLCPKKGNSVAERKGVS